jgi:hypothetical protein
MENKLIRIFTIIFWISVPTFLILFVVNIAHWLYFGTKAFPFYYLSPIIVLPLIGYLMMLIGEYFDNRKKN